MSFINLINKKNKIKKIKNKIRFLPIQTREYGWLSNSLADRRSSRSGFKHNSINSYASVWVFKSSGIGGPFLANNWFWIYTWSSGGRVTFVHGNWNNQNFYKNFLLWKLTLPVNISIIVQPSAHISDL